MNAPLAVTSSPSSSSSSSSPPSSSSSSPSNPVSTSLRLQRGAPLPAALALHDDVANDASHGIVEQWARGQALADGQRRRPSRRGPLHRV